MTATPVPPTAHDDPPTLDPHRTVIGSGAVFLDGTIVNAALKHIGQELPGSLIGVLEGQAYIVSGYLAVLAALLILSGALSDHYGRRRVYAIGLVGFAATSALCGLAPTLEWLVIFRLAQGAAGALLIPGSLALITHAFDGAARARAFGIWAAATSGPGRSSARSSAGRSSTPSAGGSRSSINVPAARRSRCGRRCATSRSRATPRRPGGSTGSARSSPRWPSAAWRSGSSAARPTSGPTRPPGSRIGDRGRRASSRSRSSWPAGPNPLVPLELFRSRAFATVNLATFFIYGALYVTFFYQAVILQGVLGYTALGGGHRRAPERASCCRSCRPGSARSPDGSGSRRFLVAGPLLMALGLLWYARIPVDSAPWRAALDDPATLVPPIDVFIDILPFSLLFGLGISCVVAPLTSTLMGSISGRFSGLGSAINNSISRVGQPLLGALIFIVDQRDVLRVARLGGRARHERPGRAPLVPAAQPAGGRDERRPDRRLEPGVARRVPPGDAHLRGAARRGRRGVVVRPARASGRAGGQRITQARRPNRRLPAADPIAESRRSARQP